MIAAILSDENGHVLVASSSKLVGELAVGELLSPFRLCTALALYTCHIVFRLCTQIIHRLGIHNGAQIVPSGYTQVRHDQNTHHLLGSLAPDNSIKSSYESYHVSVWSPAPNIYTLYRMSEHHH